MAFKVAEREESRREKLTLDIDDVEYPPRTLTIGLDRDLRKLREPLTELMREFNENADIVSGRGPTGKRKQYGKEAVKEADAKLTALADEIHMQRCKIIVGALEPADDGDGGKQSLDAEALAERVSIADINTYYGQLFDDVETLEEGPTGGSEFD